MSGHMVPANVLMLSQLAYNVHLHLGSMLGMPHLGLKGVAVERCQSICRIKSQYLSMTEHQEQPYAQQQQCMM